MTVTIVDYGSGNLHSAVKAFERASREHGLDLPIQLSSDPEQLRTSSHIVLPGVGAFADCRRGLEEIPGMVEALHEAVLHQGRPFFGICVGMQLLATRGHEHQVTQGLGWIGGDVVALETGDHDLKIPHMGWNTLDEKRPHHLLDGIPTGENGLNAYFVHSYQFVPDSTASAIATTTYGKPFASIVGRDNIVGSQFHPEKSQKLGLALIANFLRWRP